MKSLRARTALLTNFLPPYRVPMLQALSPILGDLKVFLSTAMEKNRDWKHDWTGLDVEVQRCWTVDTTWRHPSGFQESCSVHIPYDTLLRLWRYRPEVVISAEFGLRTLQAAVYCRLIRRSKLVIWATLSERSEDGRGWCREALRRWLLRAADAVIVNGASGERYIRGLGNSQVKIVPVSQVSVAKGSRQTGDGSKSDIVLVQIGQLVERKGIRETVEALERWVRRNQERTLEYWLAGSGPLEHEIRERTWPENLVVRVLGSFDYLAVQQIYANAGICVFPTLADEWGLVVNEAMAAGVPVLGSRYSQAVEELVEDGVNGWVFAPDDPADFDAALQRATETPRPVLREMGEAARRSVAHLTPQWAAERIADVIESVLQK